MSDLEFRYWFHCLIETRGKFQVIMAKQPERAVQYQVIPGFTIASYPNATESLPLVKERLQCGNFVFVGKKHPLNYRINSYKDLEEKLLPIIDKDLFGSEKLRAEFETFKKIMLMMKSKEHLTKEGVKKITAELDALRSIEWEFMKKDEERIKAIKHASLDNGPETNNLEKV